VIIDTVSLIPDFIETPYDAHAGEFETSTTLANREEPVVRERIKKPRIKLPEPRYTKIGLKEKGPKGILGIPNKGNRRDGVIGDPTKASKEKGEESLGNRY
jgi:creatinine amidohydrolase/Fe(II)-dependent formamide hydrolase-like protein